MNKKLIFAVTLVAVLALGVVGFASAQTPTPPNAPFAPGAGYGFMGGGRGGLMGGYGQMRQNLTTENVMHDAMFNVLAKGLGLTRADLDARVAKGETLAQIATSKNLSVTDFNTLWTDARKAGIEAAVTSGTFTKEQATWMLDRMTNRGNFGPGNCPYCTTPTK
jgi:hypothetical protein